MFLVGSGQCGVKSLIEEFRPVVARPVTGVVTDVEGLVAFRRLCQYGGFLLIGEVIAVGFPGVGLELVKAGMLCAPAVRVRSARVTMVSILFIMLVV